MSVRKFLHYISFYLVVTNGSRENRNRVPSLKHIVLSEAYHTMMAGCVHHYLHRMRVAEGKLLPQRAEKSSQDGWTQISLVRHYDE